MYIYARTLTEIFNIFLYSLKKNPKTVVPEIK